MSLVFGLAAYDTKVLDNIDERLQQLEKNVLECSTWFLDPASKREGTQKSKHHFDFDMRCLNLAGWYCVQLCCPIGSSRYFKCLMKLYQY